MASLGLPNALQAQAAGLKIIAQTGATRSPLLPDVPTTAEYGLPQVQMRMWFSVMAPRGTPDSVVRTLSDAVKTASESAGYREQLAQIGTESFWVSPDGLRELMMADRNKWQKVIADAGIEKVD
jgi:tripartite-type tricarboxylate transporter receptor subunit TctC